MVVYFSGTGNSRFCAQMISQKLGDELFDTKLYIRNKIVAEIGSEKPWVFVAPTYAWRLPKVFENFIRSSTFSGTKDAYFVMTCGGDIGNAQAYIETLCRDVGLKFNGVLPVVMPENYVAMFRVPEKEEADAIVNAALPVLKNGIEKIAEGKNFDPLPNSLLNKLKSGVINREFYRFCVSADKFYATDICVGCGECEKHCPLGNIEILDNRPQWGAHCTHCMACISICPQEAIEYGTRSVSKYRYRCKEYELK